MLIAAAVFLVLAIVMIGKQKKVQAQKTALCIRYGTDDPAQWVTLAAKYLADWNHYEQALQLLRTQRQELDSRRETLQQQAKALSGSSRSQWQEVLSCWDAFADAKRNAELAEHHYKTLQSVVKTAPAPTKADELTCSELQTVQYLSEATYEQQQLQQKLGQYQGQMEALGSRDGLQKELDTVNRRIQALDQTNSALEQALNALTAARQELQRRFAPRITKSAQALFAQLTNHRYDRFVLGEDLTLQAAAQDEDVLHSQQWRSDGTVDQLYLALRLAVARELTPAAPLILDDALVRFDDTRLSTALSILKQEAQEKQVILFTCHSRERTLLDE